MKKLLLLFIILLSLSFTQDRSVVITGTCLLEGQSDHSDVAVYFQAVSGSAEDNTFYTDENGAFVAGLPEGIYIVSYSHDGFVPLTLPGEINFFSDIELETLTLLSGSVMEVSGTLDGNQHWTPNFQYRVTDDLTLNSGDTLTIDPGVSVLFMGEYEFLVQGAFYANGAEGDSIRFTSGQPSKDKGDWKWLQFDYADSSSFLNYTVVEYGGGSDNSTNDANIKTYYSTLLINNSHIHSSNNTGIYNYYNSELILNNSLIHNNNHYGVYVQYSSTADISGNDIHNNNYGVLVRDYSTADISGNDIHDNNSSGVRIEYYSTADISGNDIHDNYYGVRIQSSSTADISGNDIHNNNNTGIYAYSSTLDISGNDIHDNGSYGVYVIDSSTADISGNDIHDNNYGVRLYDYSTADISGNDIHDNNSIGVYVQYSSTADIRNNILWSNWGGLQIESEGSSIGYNCFYDNGTLSYNNDYTYLPSAFGEVMTINANGDSTDTWSNLFLDPMLTDIENGDYTPQAGSPLIDAGDPAYQDLDGSIADIGMLYFDWGTEAPLINSINADNQVGSSPLIVQFSSDISGPATSRQWQFGDGGSSSNSNPVHIYSIPGSYTVSLTVDGPGGSASLSEVDFIVVNEPTSPPVANFSSDIQSGLIPFDVQFSNFSQNEIDSYLWDFGDGSSSEEESPAHTYETEGVFTVSLTATGPYGESTLTLENYITSYEAEAVVASFEMSETECVSPCFISLTNTTIGTIDAYSWDFGDGNTSTIENPVNSFIEPGAYTITLTATGPVNEDSFSQSITVYAPEPSILSINDMANDNGGFVLIEFTGSGYDVGDRTEFYIAEININGNWVTASFSPPYGDEVYGCIVHTISDSSSTSDGLSEYRVLANMDEGVFISESAWGYSVDNIHPSVPGDMFASSSNQDVNLSWSYSEDVDFGYHMVSDIDDNPSYTIENDISILLSVDYNEYHVNSVDIHGNESDNSEYASAYDLSQGANLISFSILPDDNSVGNVIQSDDITAIIGEGVASTYNPVLGWIGNLTSIEPNKGYWLASSNGEILNSVGQRYEVTDYSLHAGANLISYTCDQSASVGDIIQDEAITSIIGEGVATTYNSVLGWVGSLTNLEPGRGYWFKADSDTQLSYDCPESSSMSREYADTQPKDYIQSTEQAFYFFGNIEEAEEGDLIKAYNGDILVGSRVWNGSYTDVPVMGKDSQTETQGYITDSQVPTFKLVKKSGEELILEADIPGWSSNGIFIIENASSSAIIPNSFGLASAYPNPFNPRTIINFQVAQESNVILEVYDISGRKIRKLANSKYTQGYHSVTWDASGVSSGVYFVKMHTSEYNGTLKIMLIK